MKGKRDSGKTIGWVAVSLSTLITSFWAFWGIVENFHEGWYLDTLLENLGLMFVQYLSPMIIFLVVTLIAIRWKKIGAMLHFIFALTGIWFFHAFSHAATFLLILPLIGIGLLYWFGSFPSRKLIYKLVLGIPILTLLISGFEPIVRVSQRYDDGNLQEQLVQGNDIALIWAPEGPGWPLVGKSWEEAEKACQFLSENGLKLENKPKNIWKLPSVDEVVRSMTRHGQNSAGVWDENKKKAIYNIKPDKESPLWNIHSQVIYWWTATEEDEDHAYMVVFDGKVLVRSKSSSLPYQGFRCVKEP